MFDAGSIQATLDIDDAPFNAKLDAAKAKADELSGKNITVKVDVDTGDSVPKLVAVGAAEDAVRDSSSGASNQTDSLSDSIKGLGENIDGALPSMNGMVLGIGSVLPLLPTAVGGVVALGGALATAGTAALGFGIVAEGAISQATAASAALVAAQTAVNNATTSSARADALLRQKALIDSLSPATIALANAVSGLDNSWKSFTGGFTDQVLADVDKVVALVPQLEKLATPVIDAGGSAISQILTQISAAASSPGAQQFFAWVAGAATTDIVDLADGLGYLGAGFATILKDFGPLETDLVQGFDNIGASFSKWASSVGTSKQFQSFLSEVEKDGPEVVKTLEDVGGAAVKIGAGFGVLLGPELKVIDGLAELVNKWPALGVVLAGMFTGFEALKIISLITGPLGTMVSLAEKGAAKLGLFAASEGTVGASAATATPAVAGLGVAELGVADGAVTGATQLELFSVAELGIGASAVTAAGEVGTLGEAMATAATAGGSLLSALGLVGGAAGIFASLYYSNFNDNSDVAVNSAIPDFSAASDQTVQQLAVQVGKTAKVSLGVGTDLDQGELEDYIKQYGSTSQKSQLTQILANDSKTYSYGPGPAATTPRGSEGLTNGGTGTQPAPAPPSLISPDAAGDGYTYVAPLTGAGGSNSALTNATDTAAKAAATQVANTMQALAAVQGINVGQSLLQGIKTGVSPLDTILSGISSDLGTKATAISATFEKVFDAAVTAGNNAAQSLSGNALTAGVGAGKETDVYMDSTGTTHISSPNTNSVLLGYQADLYNDKQFVNDVKAAQALGVNADIISQFVAAGPSSDQQLGTLLSGGKSVIAQVNTADKSINALGQSYGDFVATTNYQQQSAELLTQLLAAIKGQLPADTGTAVGKAITATLPAALTSALNSVAKTAQTAAAATPSKGVFAK